MNSFIRQQILSLCRVNKTAPKMWTSLVLVIVKLCTCISPNAHSHNYLCLQGYLDILAAGKQATMFQLVIPYCKHTAPLPTWRFTLWSSSAWCYITASRLMKLYYVGHNSPGLCSLSVCCDLSCLSPDSSTNTLSTFTFRASSRNSGLVKIGYSSSIDVFSRKQTECFCAVFVLQIDRGVKTNALQNLLLQ